LATFVRSLPEFAKPGLVNKWLSGRPRRLGDETERAMPQ
jgi:hypothetical protein